MKTGKYVTIALLMSPSLLWAEQGAPAIGFELGQFENRRQSGPDSLAWDAALAIGLGGQAVQLLSEGERVDGATVLNEMRLQYLRPVTDNWSVKAGLRRDTGEQPTREWLEIGIEGAAPLGIELETMVYFGEEDRQALRFAAERAFIIAPRWTLVPETTINFYNQDDADLGTGSGLSHVELAARLAYEFSPFSSIYVGGLWGKVYGDTAEMARAAGDDVDGGQALIGISAAF